MTETLRARMLAAGHDDETIELTAANPALCAMLAQFYGLEEGGRGEEVTAVVGLSPTEEIDTAVATTDRASDAERVSRAAQELFGGFTRTQVRRVLAVCRYRRVPVEALLRTMHRLRAESWAKGWVRTRDAAECLAPEDVSLPLAC